MLDMLRPISIGELGPRAVVIPENGFARTPTGFQGKMFKGVRAERLGAVACRAARRRAGVKAKHVQRVIIGQVNTAGSKQGPFRQTALDSGLPYEVDVDGVSRVCSSGLLAVIDGAEAIGTTSSDDLLTDGPLDVVIAGGQESMSSGPSIIEPTFRGLSLVDTIMGRDLSNAWTDESMGLIAEGHSARYGFDRRIQDQFGLESFDRAIKAIKAGHFKNEIVPFPRAIMTGVPEIDAKLPDPFEIDECPFRYGNTIDEIAAAGERMKPSFLRPQGTISPISASAIADGAAFVTLMSLEKCLELGLKPVATIRATSCLGNVPPWQFPNAPTELIDIICKRLNWNVARVLHELNEAFGNTPLAAMKRYGIARELMNRRGGGIALGHPIGASGARILITLLNIMLQDGDPCGIASLCVGGGMAAAIALQLIAS